MFSLALLVQSCIKRSNIDTCLGHSRIVLSTIQNSKHCLKNRTVCAIIRIVFEFWKTRKSTMNRLITASANVKFDDLFEEVCTAVQLTKTQYDLAVGHYEAVGDVLDQDQLISSFN